MKKNGVALIDVAFEIYEFKLQPEKTIDTFNLNILHRITENCE